MEAQDQAGQTVDRSTLRRAIGACAIGNATEWYDFTTYGYLAAIIGAVFFPSENDSVQLLAAFAAFAAAFVVRPLGGLFFGPLGDKIGRQSVLATTIILMAAATFAIALLPGYATIGIWAPILLVFLRVVQGFSTGGEYGGAATFMAEYAPDNRRGFLTSWLEFGTLSGVVLGASLVTILTIALPEEAMNSWGWRVPFLIAGPLGIAGLYLRLKLEDTPGFKALEEAGEVEESPLKDTFTQAWQPMLLCGGITILVAIAAYVFYTFMPSYLTNVLDVGENTSLLILVLALLVMMAVITFVGRLSDRVGRKRVLGGACVGFILLSYPAFWLMSLGNWFTTIAGVLIIALLLVLTLGTIPSTLPALFPTKSRYGGFAISYNVSVSAFGGTAPLIVTALVSATGSIFMPAFYLMAAALVAIIPISLMAETARQPLIGSVALSEAPEPEAQET
jgi:MHS family proline/betaine transporter-like MFS transporter